jgi:hypothetical protein
MQIENTAGEAARGFRRGSGYEAALSRVFAKTTADAQNKPAKAAQSAAVAKLTHNDASAAR